MACTCEHSEAAHDPPGHGECTRCECVRYEEKYTAEPEQGILDEELEIVRSTPLPGEITGVDVATGASYTRPTIANRESLLYVLEHDQPDGVGMDEVMAHFNMSVFQQGHLALAMKDAVKLGYAEQVAAHGEQYRWRVTDRGRRVLTGGEEVE